METSTLRNRSSDDWSPEQIQLSVRPAAVARARDAVRRAAARAGMPGRRIDDLVVAVSEACTNAMEAQVRAGSDDPIGVTCAVTDGIFEVQVRDHGPGFEPATLPRRPPVSDPRHLDVERGWGIQLMRELVDELVFDVTGTGSCVHLRVAL